MRKSAVSIVKHSENEKSATKTTKKHSNIDFFDFRCSFSLFFLCLKREKIIPSADPADLPDPVRGLPLGTSPTRAGGQDDVSSQANSLKLFPTN